MKLLYFAYGSNLHPGRLRARIDSAEPVGIARLPEHRLAFHKRGADGSGKGNIIAAAGREVWGVIYAISADHGERLDDIEGSGYARTDLEVIRADQAGKLSVFSYRARAGAIVEGLRPFSWYLDFVVRGAVQHGLPAGYVNGLRRSATVADPDVERVRQAEILLKPDPGS